MNQTLKIPAHVSIIMDGNGRWAQQHGRERVYGHLNGVESVRAVTEASVRLGIRYLSVYAFSEENWGRPGEEVTYLMSLMMKSLAAEVETFMHNGVRLRVLGNRSRLPGVLSDAIDQVEKMTASNDRLTLILFLSYSGRWDILNAAKEIARKAAEGKMSAEDIDNLQIEDFSKNLVTDGVPDPDLIIRTSGEQRLSNYLLWQGAYSEFYFSPVLWPDFREKEFIAAIEEFSRRDRRYGKLNEDHST